MSIATPPKGFVDLATAYKQPEGSLVSVIGVVVDLMTPMVTRSGHHLLTFKLLDYRLSMEAEGSQGLSCRSFKEDAESLPRVRNIGDVVLFRNVKITTYEYQRIALTNWSTACLVFPEATIPSPGFSYAYANNHIERLGVPRDVANFNLLEQEYVIRIKEDMKGRVQQLHAKAAARAVPEDGSLDAPPPKRFRTTGDFNATTSGLGKKFRLIEDLRTWDYADIIGFVVKCFPTQYGGCDLYVTDYTANEGLRYYAAPEEATLEERDGDSFGYSNAPKKSWRGPFGHLVMKINVKQPHATFAANHLNEGDVVLLRNVKRRICPEGAFLEGDMWPDHHDRDKIKMHKIRDLSSPECQAMIKRKEKYWISREAKLQQLEQAGQQKKSKTAKKKEKKGRRAARIELNADHAVNKHVRCTHIDGVSVIKVSDILDPDNVRHINEAPDGSCYALPFINARYRAKVRVVDYYPKALEDFAKPPDAEGSMLDPDAWTLEASPKYEWAFSLLLEEAMDSDKSCQKHRLWVHLQHDQAQYLLGNQMPDPDDLWHRPDLLGQLRERLFILWGNLLETQEKGREVALSNKPFQCCIEEYGIELDSDDPARHMAHKGFQRMYSMFGTTIQ